MSEKKVAFLDARYFSSQSELLYLKRFPKALNGWKKTGPPKKPLLLDV